MYRIKSFLFFKTKLTDLQVYDCIDRRNLVSIAANILTFKSL